MPGSAGRLFVLSSGLQVELCLAGRGHLRAADWPAYKRPPISMFSLSLLLGHIRLVTVWSAPTTALIAPHLHPFDNTHLLIHSLVNSLY